MKSGRGLDAPGTGMPGAGGGDEKFRREPETSPASLSKCWEIVKIKTYTGLRADCRGQSSDPVVQVAGEPLMED